MRYYKYIPWTELRKMYRRRRELVAGIRIAVSMLPAAMAITAWILF